MLNEYKKPMWNDGFVKDQPWLNYFNEYERTHCCFDGDGGTDDGGNEGYGYVDEAFSTSLQGTATAATSAAQSAASAADSQTGQNTAGGVGIDDDPNSLTADQAAAAMTAADAAKAAELSPEAQQAAADAVAAEEMGIDIGDVAGGLAGANVSMQEIDALEDLGLIGYNERTDLGYFDKLDADIRQQDKKQAAELNKELAKEYGPNRAKVSVDKQGNYTWSGPDAWSAFPGRAISQLAEISPLYQAGKAVLGKDGLGGIISGVGRDLGNMGRDVLGLLTGTPSDRETLSRLPGSDKDLSGLAGIGESRGGLKGEKGSEGYVSPQAKLSADRNAAAIAEQERMETGGVVDPLEVAYRAELNELAKAEQERMETGGVVDPAAQAYRDALADMNSIRENNAFTAMQKDADRKQAALAAATKQAAIEDLISGRQMTADQEAALMNAALSKREMERDVNINPNRRAAGGMVYRNVGGGVEEKPKSAMELYLEKLGQPSKYTVPTVEMNVPSMAPPPNTSDPIALAEYRKNLARETMGNYLPFDAGGASSAINTFNENYYGGASNVNPYNVAQLASLYGLPKNQGTYEGIIGMLGGVRNEPPPPPVIPDPVVEPEPPIIIDDNDTWSMYDEEEIDNAWARHGGGIRDVLYRQTGGPTYDPVREAEAERRAREVQALKVGELDEAPQTRAEREALQASGGMYRDEEGAVRDAQGNVQEDFGFDYTAPPEPGRPDPVNTPDTPPPVVPDDPVPLPDDLIALPYDPVMPGPDDPFQPRPVLPYVGNPEAPYPFSDKPLTYLPDLSRPNPYQPMIGPQLQPTGLQGLQQGMGQGFNSQNPNYIPPSTRPIMNQNLQGFGMQSPTPFGTQQPFSSGFGGFGQQPNYNSPYAR